MLDDVVDNTVHVHECRLQDLLAAEGEQLLGQPAGPNGRSVDQLDLPAQWVVRGKSLGQYFPLRPMITVSRLLKSWATPPAKRPMASIFWA